MTSFPDRPDISERDVRRGPAGLAAADRIDPSVKRWIAICGHPGSASACLEPSEPAIDTCRLAAVDTRPVTESWPDSWAELKAGADCAMCANQGLEDNGFGVRFLEGAYADVFLQRLDLSPGYSIAIWKHEHVAELTHLSAEALAGFTAETVQAGKAIEELFDPAKLNFETLGNGLPHLHTHIVPRFIGDPAPGWPLIGAAGVRPKNNIAGDVFTEQLARLRSAVDSGTSR